MKQDECLAELERQLGAKLPAEYRRYLLSTSESHLTQELSFSVPNADPGVLNYIFTAAELLENSNNNCLGDPARGMMFIGSDMMDGWLYMCVRDTAFGHIFYKPRAHHGSDYAFLAESFEGFMAMCRRAPDVGA